MHQTLGPLLFNERMTILLQPVSETGTHQPVRAAIARHHGLAGGEAQHGIRDANLDLSPPRCCSGSGRNDHTRQQMRKCAPCSH